MHAQEAPQGGRGAGWLEGASLERGMRGAVAAALLVATALALARLPVVLASALAFGLAFALVTLVHPWAAFLVLPFAVPFGSLVEVRAGIASVGATELAFLWAVVVWCAAFLARKVGRVRWPAGVTLAFGAFLTAALCSTTQSPSLQYSLKELLKWLQFALTALLVYNLLAEGEGPQWLPQALLVAVLCAGSLAALQGIVQFVGGIGPPGFLLFGRFMRAYGTFQQPNPYGGYLGLVFPLAYALALWAPGRPRERVLWSALSWGATALTALALLMTWSRGAWLGAAAAFAAVSALRSRQAAFAFGMALVLLVVLAGLGLLGALPPALTERFAGLAEYLTPRDVSHVEPTPANWAVVERLAHWQAAWAMFREHPWLGVGWGNYVPVYPAYALPRWADPLGHAHNYYLNVLAEAGLVGLAGYLFFWTVAFWVAWRASRQGPPFLQAASLGILGVFVHLSVHNFVDNLYVHGMPFHLGLLLGVALWAREGRGPADRAGAS
ncbi:MAG: O-antigen ligase family protein [Anaerolineae bacterium]